MSWARSQSWLRSPASPITAPRYAARAARRPSPPRPPRRTRRRSRRGCGCNRLDRRYPGDPHDEQRTGHLPGDRRPACAVSWSAGAATSSAWLARSSVQPSTSSPGGERRARRRRPRARSPAKSVPSPDGKRRRPALMQVALADRDLAGVDPRGLHRDDHPPAGRRRDRRPRAPRGHRRRRTGRIGLPSCHLPGHRPLGNRQCRDIVPCGSSSPRRDLRDAPVIDRAALGDPGPPAARRGTRLRPAPAPSPAGRGGGTRRRWRPSRRRPAAADSTTATTPCMRRIRIDSGGSVNWLTCVVHRGSLLAVGALAVAVAASVVGREAAFTGHGVPADRHSHQPQRPARRRRRPPDSAGR